MYLIGEVTLWIKYLCISVYIYSRPYICIKKNKSQKVKRNKSKNGQFFSVIISLYFCIYRQMHTQIKKEKLRIDPEIPIEHVRLIEYWIMNKLLIIPFYNLKNSENDHLL